MSTITQKVAVEIDHSNKTTKATNCLWCCNSKDAFDIISHWDGTLYFLIYYNKYSGLYCILQCTNVGTSCVSETKSNRFA